VAQSPAVKSLVGGNFPGEDYGYMYGAWILNTVPVQAVATLPVGDRVYLTVDDGYVKMVTNKGVAKYYRGTLEEFDPSDWGRYLEAGTGYLHSFLPEQVP